MARDWEREEQRHHRHATGRLNHLALKGGERRSLERSVGGSASDHLTNAWNEAYGRHRDPVRSYSDPVKSYSETIKAVEAALAPRVTPQNPKQTLGTMIADVRNAPQNFEFPMHDGPNSVGVEAVLAMMLQLWEGQTSRHSSTTPTRAETVDEAKTAVHVGAAVVQCGASGAFRRRS